MTMEESTFMEAKTSKGGVIIQYESVTEEDEQARKMLILSNQ